jgi:hypothetical protein
VSAMLRDHIKRGEKKDFLGFSCFKQLKKNTKEKILKRTANNESNHLKTCVSRICGDERNLFREKCNCITVRYGLFILQLNSVNPGCFYMLAASVKNTLETSVKKLKIK